MSVQLDLFDLLDAPSEGAITTWDRIKQLSPWFVGTWFQIALEQHRPLSMGGYSSSTYRYEYDSRGIWIGRTRHEGKPDLTWTQIHNELEARKQSMPPGVWANVEALWAAYEDTFIEFADAHNAPGYYSSDPAWWARTRAAEAETSKAYGLVYRAFLDAYDLKEKA